MQLRHSIISPSRRLAAGRCTSMLSQPLNANVNATSGDDDADKLARKRTCRCTRAGVLAVLLVLALGAVAFLLATKELRSSSSPSPSTGAGDTLTLMIVPTNITSPPIATNFIGFSLETFLAQTWTGFVPGTPRPSFVNLMRQLMVSDDTSEGPVFRIGGNSADRSWYNPDNLPFPTDLPGPPFEFNFTDAQMLSLYHAARAVNGSLVFGLNFRRPGNASWAIAHVSALRRLIGFNDSALKGLEIGNEPDLYSHHSVRPTSWTFDDYMNEFAFYTSELRTAFPDLPAHFFQGGVLAGQHPWVMQLPRYVQHFRDEVYSADMHHYPYCNCKTMNATLDELFLETAASSLSDFLTHAPGNLVQQVNDAGAPMLIGEGNSVCCGGKPNTTNVFGVNLWAIDEFFYSASIGLAHWTIHSGSQNASQYAPLIWPSSTSDVPLVQALYYGLRFFADATANRASIVGTVVQTSNQMIRTWVTLSTTQRVTVVVLYKDRNATLPATITVSLASGTYENDCLPNALLYRLEAPSVLEPYNITYAGQTYMGTTDGMPISVRTSELIPVAARATSMSDSDSNSPIWTFDIRPMSAVQLHVETRSCQQNVNKSSVPTRPVTHP